MCVVYPIPSYLRKASGGTRERVLKHTRLMVRGAASHSRGLVTPDAQQPRAQPTEERPGIQSRFFGWSACDRTTVGVKPEGPDQWHGGGPSLLCDIFFVETEVEKVDDEHRNRDRTTNKRSKHKKKRL